MVYAVTVIATIVLSWLLLVARKRRTSSTCAPNSITEAESSSQLFQGPIFRSFRRYEPNSASCQRQLNLLQSQHSLCTLQNRHILSLFWYNSCTSPASLSSYPKLPMNLYCNTAQLSTFWRNKKSVINLKLIRTGRRIHSVRLQE